MSLQYFHRTSCTHALRVPGDVQKVSRLQTLTSIVRIQPSPDFIYVVVLRNEMCDVFTVRRGFNLINSHLKLLFYSILGACT